MSNESEMKWLVNKDTWQLGRDLPSLYETLAPGVYQVEEEPMFGIWKLVKISDSFEINYKTYDIYKPEIDRIVTAFNNLDSNLGVLFKGTQGTGKTVAAKLICNALKLPVILANKKIVFLNEIMMRIKQPLIVFFDEFEKVYDLRREQEEYDEEGKVVAGGLVNLLSMIDGVETQENKRLFIFTTNRVYLPTPLESRPSRIRYIKEFKNLEVSSIKLILEDVLEDHSHIPNIVDFLQRMALVTVDIVKQVANEVNIFEDSSYEFLKLINVTGTISSRVSIYKEDTLLGMINENHIYEDSFFNRIGRHYFEGGVITKVDAENKTFTFEYASNKSGGRDTTIILRWEDVREKAFEYAF